jgi:hypothetical protein
MFDLASELLFLFYASRYVAWGSFTTIGKGKISMGVRSVFCSTSNPNFVPLNRGKKRFLMSSSLGLSADVSGRAPYQPFPVLA